MKVYLDNAATTPMAPEVVDAMVPVMKEYFGNPSSIHSYGRKTRAMIEMARKRIAKTLNAQPSEIFFTSGGTEADNMAIMCSVRDLGIKHCISTRIEHHAVLHTLECLKKEGQIKLSFVNLLPNGDVDLEDLERLLAENDRSLVSLMHANNEIGNLLPIEHVGDLCEKYNAIFHSDTVQSMAHYPFDLSALKLHYVTGAAHKFHGPKGVGFLYVNNKVKIDPMIHGGAQERNMRGGTENLIGIVGLDKAMELAYEDVKGHQEYVKGLKTHMIQRLKQQIPGVRFNGTSADVERSLYTVLSISLPTTEIAAMLLLNLDIMGIAVSGGSACSSGSSIGSHVLAGINSDPERPVIRFSLSRYTRLEEIDYALDKLIALYVTENV
jgi:cysteine desulfurase